MDPVMRQIGQAHLARGKTKSLVIEAGVGSLPLWSV